MGMCALGGILQAKVYQIIGDIKGVKTYIGYILVIVKDILSNHIEKLSFVFGGLHVAGLKVNAPDFSFGLK